MQSFPLRAALALALLLLSLPALAAGKPVILIVGDSLSAGYGLRPGEGWVALLERRLKSQAYGQQVVNASVSGETTGGGLARLPRALSLHKPSIVVIALGGNDGLRGLPPAEVSANLEQMIVRSKSAGARVVLAGIRIPTNYGQAYTDRFYAIYPALAKRHKVPLVPFILEGVALDDSLFQADGIHPNAAAQPKLLANVWAQLGPMLQKKAAPAVR